MKQLEFFDVPSPCIGICQSGPKGYCMGCFRSREERHNWLKIDDATRLVINKACVRRKAAYTKRKLLADSSSGLGVQEQQPDQGQLF